MWGRGSIFLFCHVPSFLVHSNRDMGGTLIYVTSGMNTTLQCPLVTFDVGTSDHSKDESWLRKGLCI